MDVGGKPFEVGRREKPYRTTFGGESWKRHAQHLRRRLYDFRSETNNHPIARSSSALAIPV